MKHSILGLSLLLSMAPTFAQDASGLDSMEKVIIAQELEKEAANDQHDKKTKRLLKKLALTIKSSAQKVESEVAKLGDCVNCAHKSKNEVVLTNIGRKLGKGSAWVTTFTSKPFMQASGYLTGLAEKKEDNQDVIAIYKFFLKNQKEFDLLYQQADRPEDLAALMLDKMEDIVDDKLQVIMKDFLAHIGLESEIPQNIFDFELSEEAMASIDLSKIDASFINNHPEYQELRPILGTFSHEELSDFLIAGYLDKNIAFKNYKNALPKLHEGLTALAGQIFAPKIALGIISKSLVSLYTMPVVAADIGTGISALICLDVPAERLEEDRELAGFCSYVVNRTSYQLIKSRAKGYVAGKKAREKLDKRIVEQQERQAKRKELKQALH
jgi:hypothetical protein